MTLRINRLTLMLGALAACAILAATGRAADDAPLDEPDAAAPTVAQDNPEVMQAAGLFKKRDFEGARKALDEAFQANPKMPPANVVMAQWFSQIRNQAAAVRSSLERAVLDDPTDPEAFVILGDFNLRAGRVTEAELLYGKANTLLASFTRSEERKQALQPRVFSGLAQVAEARRDWVGAQSELEKWLAIDAENATALQRLARALFQQDKAEEAKIQLKAAYTARPEMRHWGATMAQFYEQAGDHDAATQWMEYALKLVPQDLRTRLVAGQWALETGQFDLAKEHATVATQIDATSLEAKILRGVVALFQKDYAASESYFESAMLARPNNFAAKNNLALALAEQDDDAKRQRARAYADENSKLYPKSAEAASTYGRVLYRLGDLRNADIMLRQAASLGRVSEDTAYYMAQLYADTAKRLQEAGNAEQATRLTEQAKQLLEGTLSSPRPFSMRTEAERLKQELGL